MRSYRVTHCQARAFLSSHSLTSPTPARYDPPQRVLDGVRAADLQPVRVAADGWDARYKRGRGCWTPKHPGKNVWCGDMPQGQATLARRSYLGSVRFVDEWVGKIMAALTEGGLLSSTLVSSSMRGVLQTACKTPADFRCEMSA